MNKPLALLAVAGTALLAACGSKTDANEKNFSAALTQYLEKKGELCLGARRWPVELQQMELRMRDSIPAGPAGQMAALEGAGLVSGVDADVEGTGFNAGLKYKVRRYTLTDAAKPFMREREVSSLGMNGRTMVKEANLCWGQKALNQIVKWEGPMKFGDYQEVVVVYTYALKDVAEWAKKPEIQSAFPHIKSHMDDAEKKQARHPLKLTSEGWEAKGLD